MQIEKTAGNKESKSTWNPNYTTLSAEAEQSGIRENSLVNRFAAEFLEFRYETKNPMEMGYMSVTCPIKRRKIKPPLFMMIFRISLGSLGALADTAELCTNLCTAWCIENGRTNWFVGMQMSGGTGEKTFSLQSLLSVRFKSISLSARLEKEKLNYYLELRNFRVSLAGYEFPNKSNNVMIFSDPADPAKKGWYGYPS